MVHGCLLRSLVERPHCFKYHPLIIHLHTCITSPSLFPKFIYPAQHLKLSSWRAPKNLFFPLSSPFQFLSFPTFCCFRKKWESPLTLLIFPHPIFSPSEDFIGCIFKMCDQLCPPVLLPLCANPCYSCFQIMAKPSPHLFVSSQPHSVPFFDHNSQSDL